MLMKKRKEENIVMLGYRNVNEEKNIVMLGHVNEEEDIVMLMKKRTL